jgi:hypothetical protein
MASRERSPNYPSLNLEDAVQLFKTLYDAERRQAVSIEVAAKALGHTPSANGRLSGPAVSKLASLRQYGLIEDAGRGKVKVSEQALDLKLHDPGEPEFERAAKIAALKPSLFAELHADYGEASDNALRDHLFKERKFSEDGAARVIRAYRDTVSFAKLGTESYNPPSDEPRGENSMHAATAERPRTQAPRFPPPEDAPNFPLPDGLTGRVVLSGTPTKKALLRLAQRVKEWAEDLAPSESGETD